MGRSHRSPAFLVSQEAFWNCDDPPGRLTDSLVLGLQVSWQLTKYCLFDWEEEGNKDKEKSPVFAK